MPVPHMTAEEFRRRGHEAIDFVASYLESVASRPITPSIQPGDLFRALPQRPPERGEPWDAIIQDFHSLILPAVTHWQSPGFFGFFPCNNSEPAILGELLSAGLGVNGFLWLCSPAITELEMRVMDWLGGAIGLPRDFLFGEDYARSTGGGVIHGTASEAVLTALVAARDRLGAPAERLVLYCTSQSHSSVTKAAMIAGLGREHVRQIAIDDRLAMRPEALARQMKQDRAAGLTPCMVCATVGTTSTGAIDPIAPIADAAAREAPGAWLHIDAAYAGAACVCPEFRSIIDGVERADSFNFNPHKWLLSNFDCSAFWTRDRAALTHALSINPEYLKTAATDSGRTIEYRDWQIPLGRRFRALKLWFVLRHYGVEGLRAHIREHVRLADIFESLVRADPRFEVMTPRSLSLVCFRHRGSDDANRRLADRANATGRIYLTTTAVPIGPRGEPRTVIRMAIGATRTAERHVRDAWELIQSQAGDAGN
jgi:aromatic-L-amino-acid decarboxylase